MTYDQISLRSLPLNVQEALFVGAQDFGTLIQRLGFSYNTVVNMEISETIQIHLFTPKQVNMNDFLPTRVGDGNLL